MNRHLFPAAIAVALASAPAAVVHAQASDPAAVQINAFDNTLLEVMRNAKRLGAHGRFERLQPAIERTFDLAYMTRVAVGSTWSSVSAADQASLVRAFSRFTVATFAHNFDNYSGQHFVLDKVETRGPDKLVVTRIVSPGSSATLAYRMRDSGGSWKVIDINYNGTVSSILGQRSEFASTLRSGGAPALVRKLNGKTDELLK